MDGATETESSDTLTALTSAPAVEAEIDEVAGHLNALHARLVDTAVVLSANPSWWRDDSVVNLAKYLCWRTAISPERAKQLVTIAERAAELPVCMTRFRAGELSVDHMAAIARRAPWWVDAELAELAPMLTTHQLRGTLATYQFPLIPKPTDLDHESAGGDIDPEQEAGPDDADNTGVDADADAAGNTEALPDADAGPNDGGDDPGAADDADVGDDGAAGATADHTVTNGGDTQAGDAGGGCESVQAESLWFGWDDHGRFQLHGVLAADTGLIVEAALKESADRLFRETGTTISWPDALRDLAERSLDQTESPDRRDRYRIHVHLDTDGVCTDAAGRWLPDTIRRHIGCDGTLSPILTNNGVPIAVGRSQHIVPARTRRHVLARDHAMCRVPGCGNTRYVEIHHIIHWEHHGVTEPWNLLTLCPHHHRLHHRGQLGITGNADQPDGITFTNRHGQPIPTSGAKPQAPPGPPEPPPGNYRHPLGEPLHTKWLYFNPPRPRDHQRAG